MSHLDLRTAEDVEMRSNARFERWKDEYEAGWVGGEIMGQLAQLNNMIDPETRKILHQVSPDAMAKFEAMFDSRKAAELARQQKQYGR